MSDRHWSDVGWGWVLPRPTGFPRLLESPRN